VGVTVTNPDLQTGTLEVGFTFFHTVTLSWTDSTSDVKGYNIYRSSTSGGPYTRLNVNLISGTTFTDENVQPGETLFYVATSDSTDNVEGEYSDEANVTVPSP
jgi:fibronectin type 3 domain-containing protein